MGEVIAFAAVRDDPEFCEKLGSSTPEIRALRDFLDKIIAAYGLVCPIEKKDEARERSSRSAVPSRVPPILRVIRNDADGPSG